MIACGRCNHENEPSEVNCVECGTPLDDVSARALIGTVVLGTYQITDVLGQGGMSVVYKARHKLTDQKVALKILPPELAVHSAIKTRFVEEAKALARLEHPGIVHLYNFGEEGGRFVLAMQFVEGQTFEKKILDAGRLAWPEAVRVCSEVLRALDYAHGRGIVHRDMKPSNVLVKPDGSATVMDFGIAKMTESSRLTQTGQTMGTVRYMSPEQVRGNTVDLRTDIYSLGVTLYEALVGDTPFDGNTHFEIMSKHLSEAPQSIRDRGVDIPAELDLIVLQSMAKAPDDRFATADAFRAALDEVLAAHPQEAAAARSTPLPAVVTPRAAPTAVTAARVEPATGLAAGAGAGTGATGLAHVLEPGEERIPRSRAGLWIGLAVLVAGAAAALIVFLNRSGSKGYAGTGGDTGQPAAAVPDAAESAAMPEWPEPLRLANLEIIADQKFEADQVRVLTTRKGHKAESVAKSYLAARARFLAYVTRERAGTVEIHPLNLVVAPTWVMCDRRLYTPYAPPEKCEAQAFYYEPRTRTLFVVDDKSLDVQSIPQGAAVHLCRTTPALHTAGCTMLMPYMDEVEKGL